MPVQTYETFAASASVEGDDDFGIDKHFSFDSNDGQPEILDDSLNINDNNDDGDEDEDDDAVRVSGKKRGRGRPRLYLDPKPARIFKHDLRRQYPTMFVSVMNSCDYNMFMSFFDNFAVPTMIVQKKPISAEELQKLPPGTTLPPLPVVPFRGSDWVRFHFLQANCFCADRTFRVEKASIVTRSDVQSSIIVMDVVNELTYLYAVDPITMIDAMLGLKIHPIPEDAEPLPEKKYSHAPVNQSLLNLFPASVSDCPAQLFGAERQLNQGLSIADLHHFYCQQTGEFGIPLLAEPERLQIRTQLRLYLTPSKHIEKIEIGNGKLSHAVGPTPRLWSKVRHLRWRNGL